MPAPLAVDWEQAQALFCKGLPLRDISERTGIPLTAIRKRSVRHKWEQRKTEVGQAVTASVQDSLIASSSAWVRKIDQMVHRTIDSVIKRDPDTLSGKQLQELMSAASQCASMARANYGLDKQAATQKPTMVQVNVHNAPGPGTSNVATAKAAIVTDIVDIDTAGDTPALPPTP